jgi:hypothetical protein
MRFLVTLLFIATLFIFANAAYQQIVTRFGRPLARHRIEHDAIESRLEDLEERVSEQKKR